MEDVSWGHFAQGTGTDFLTMPEPGLSDNDRIWVRFENVLSANDTEFVLETASNITWWKELKLVRANGEPMGLIMMQDDDHGPRGLRIPVDQLAGATVHFSKAKLFGVHTGMHKLIEDFTSLGGQRVTFTWDQD